MGAYEIRARSATTHSLSYQLAYGGCPKALNLLLSPQRSATNTPSPWTPCTQPWV